MKIRDLLLAPEDATAGALTCNICGEISCYTEHPIRRDPKRHIAFCTLNDDTGGIKCIVFSGCFDAVQSVLKSGRPVTLRGTVHRGIDEHGLEEVSLEVKGAELVGDEG